MTFKDIAIIIRNNKPIFIISILLPIILGVCCIFSIPLLNVAGSSAWLSFWGGYLGSTIMAGVTLYVLEKQLKQNHTENENTINTTKIENIRNRELTLSLKWFDDLTNAAIDLQNAFQLNDVVLLEDLGLDSSQIDEKIKILMDTMNKAWFAFQLKANRFNNKTSNKQIRLVQTYVEAYQSVLSDVNSISVYSGLLQDILLNHTEEDGEVRQQKIDKAFEFCAKHKNVDIGLQYFEKYFKFADKSNTKELKGIFHQIFKRLDAIDIIEIQNTITTYIQTEYKHITHQYAET